MAEGEEQFSCVYGIHISALESCLFSSLPVSGLDESLLLFKFHNSLFIVSTNSVCDVVGRDFFSHYVGCLFTPLIVFFVVQKLLSFVQPHFSIF